MILWSTAQMRLKSEILFEYLLIKFKSCNFAFTWRHHFLVFVFYICVYIVYRCMRIWLKYKPRRQNRLNRPHYPSLSKQKESSGQSIFLTGPFHFPFHKILQLIITNGNSVKPEKYLTLYLITFITTYYHFSG